jgi:hypothetical protein
VRSLLEQRTSLYSQAGLHITEPEGDTSEDVAKRILEAIPSVLKTQVSHYKGSNYQILPIRKINPGNSGLPLTASGLSKISSSRLGR